MRRDARATPGERRVTPALAALLAAAACTPEPSTRSLAVELRLEMPPVERVLLVSPLPGEVQVTVRGPTKEVDALGPLPPVAVDLRTAPARVDLPTAPIALPPGLELLSVEPGSLQPVWEEQAARELPIHVEVFGAPADGYRLQGEVSTDPPVMIARGPKAIVDRLGPIQAGAFDLNGLAEGTHTAPVRLERPPERVVYGGTSVEGRAVIVPFTARRPRRR